METRRNKIKYFLYARKSEENEDRQVQSIDDQIKVLKELAARGGHVVKEILTESHSAKNPGERPVFNSMLERIDRREASGILCWQINRLSRNPVDSARVQWMLQQGIIESIQTIDGERRPEDNALLLSVESGVSNQFIIDLRKNVKRGLLSKVEKGWVPCLPSAGYLNEPRERTIVRDPERFDLIQRMWKFLLSEAYTPSQILRIANKEWGYRTRKTKRSGNKELSASGLYKIFNNPFYCGLISYGGRSYTGKHDPMVTVEQFNKAQSILGRKGRPRPRQHEHAYKGVLRCDCGCAITAETKSKLVKSEKLVRSYTYYHCTKRIRHCVCGERGSVSEGQLESQIHAALISFETAPEFLAVAEEIISEQRSAIIKERESERETQKRTLVDTKRQLSSLTTMRYRGLIDDEEFIREKEALKNTEVRLELALQESNSELHMDEETERAFRFATRCRLAFEHGDPQLRKTILIGLGSNQRLFDKTLSVEAADWLKCIKEDYDALVRDFGRLEPWIYGQDARQKEAFALIRERMCTTVDAVRTILQEKKHPPIPEININGE